MGFFLLPEANLPQSSCIITAPCTPGLSQRCVVTAHNVTRSLTVPQAMQWISIITTSL